jgi:hypothetical protein
MKVGDLVEFDLDKIKLELNTDEIEDWGYGIVTSFVKKTEDMPYQDNFPQVMVYWTAKADRNPVPEFTSYLKLIHNGENYESRK